MKRTLALMTLGLPAALTFANSAHAALGAPEGVAPMWALWALGIAVLVIALLAYSLSLAQKCAQRLYNELQPHKAREQKEMAAKWRAYRVESFADKYELGVKAEGTQEAVRVMADALVRGADFATAKREALAAIPAIVARVEETKAWQASLSPPATDVLSGRELPVVA